MFTTADLIQFGVLLVTLLALVYQVANQRKETQMLEERTANKLKIFFLCQDTARSEKEIIEHFKNMRFGTAIDEAEIKKSIYEMLKDGTLRYRTNNTFKARRNKAEEDD